MLQEHKGILEILHGILALIIIEVKSGFTASMVVCLAMNIQEYVLSKKFTGSLQSRFRLHAIVISLITLVCWIHQAKELYTYVFKIMSIRAVEAPFLNPPLTFTYNLADHHVLWNKKQLFFNDWELRFGLWKCFRQYPITLEKYNKSEYDKNTQILSYDSPYSHIIDFYLPL